MRHLPYTGSSKHPVRTRWPATSNIMPLVANVSEHVSYETRTSAKQCSQVLSDKQHGGKPVSWRVYDERPDASDHQVGSCKIMTLWPRQKPFTTGDIHITKQQVRHLTVLWLLKDQFRCSTLTRSWAEHRYLPSKGCAHVSSFA